MVILADQIADREIVRPSSTTSPTSGGSWWRVVAGDLLALAFLIIGIMVAFGKTVFSGEAISRFYQLGQRDSLFAKYFSSVREAYDASVYQYFVPNHVFTTRSLSEGNLPLWNPLTGCGAPHLADVETAVLWPLRLALLMVEPLRAWNLLLVLNIVIYATGTYVLSRVIGLNRLPHFCRSGTCLLSIFDFSVGVNRGLRIHNTAGDSRFRHDCSLNPFCLARVDRSGLRSDGFVWTSRAGFLWYLRCMYLAIFAGSF